MTHYMSSPEKSHNDSCANIVFSIPNSHPEKYLPEDCFQSESYVGWFPVYNTTI